MASRLSAAITKMASWKAATLAMAVTTALTAALAASFLLAGSFERDGLLEEAKVKDSQIAGLRSEVDSLRGEAEACRLAAVHLREAGALMAQSTIDWLDTFPYAELDLTASNAEVASANALPCESFSY